VDEDREFALRLRKGDAEGLAGLMARHQDRLFRYLRRLVGEDMAAQDVFQQTWLRVAERIRRYDLSRPFAPWLFAVARNLAYDHLRERRPERREDREAVARGVDRGPDPLAQVLARERDDELAEAVNALGASDREVLALRFGEEQSLPDLARTLGLPLPTAKARLYRALARLRERLASGEER
jgi:RNA polymerase sigma-70 factor (ECF subfamily)